jgi:hypothetical protein
MPLELGDGVAGGHKYPPSLEHLTSSNARLCQKQIRGVAQSDLPSERIRAAARIQNEAKVTGLRFKRWPEG